MMPANLSAVATSARARLLDAVASVLAVDPSGLTDASSPATIPSWDSLNHLNIAMAIESEFNVTLTPEQVMEMGDIAGMCATLRHHGVDIP